MFFVEVKYEGLLENIIKYWSDFLQLDGHWQWYYFSWNCHDFEIKMERKYLFIKFFAMFSQNGFVIIGIK